MGVLCRRRVLWLMKSNFRDLQGKRRAGGVCCPMVVCNARRNRLATPSGDRRVVFPSIEKAMQATAFSVTYELPRGARLPLSRVVNGFAEDFDAEFSRSNRVYRQ